MDTLSTSSTKEIYHWNFFDDPIDNGKDAIFGMDIALNKVVNVLKAGAQRYGTEKAYYYFMALLDLQNQL